MTIPEHFSDDQAKAIIARAIELDSREPTTTADEIRALASDIGISPASLEAAFREQAISLQARPVVTERRAARTVVGLGVPLGAAAGFVLITTPYNGLLGLGLMTAGLLASGALVVVGGTTGKLRSFQLRNLAMWGSVAAGSLAVVTMFGTDAGVVPATIAVGWCVKSWITSSILGSAAVFAIRRARAMDDSPPDHHADIPAATGGGYWARLAKRVSDWLQHPLRRTATLASSASA